MNQKQTHTWFASEKIMKRRTSKKSDACDPPLQGGARVGGTRTRVRNQLLPPEENGGVSSYNLRRRGTNPCRATTNNNITEDQEVTVIQHLEDHDNDPAAEDVADAMRLPANEAINEVRSRFKWSIDMNTYLYRTYLLITNMETTRTPYGRQLHQKMIERFPELANKTMQNILDQRRQLFTKNRLPSGVIKQIRDEVAHKLNLVIAAPDNNQIEEENQIRLVTEEEQRAHNIFQENLLLYSGMDPCLRPNIPRLRTTKNTYQLIKTVDDILKQRIPECKNLTDYHDYIYTAAITTLMLHDQQLQGKKINKRKKKPDWEERLERKINKIRKDIGILTQYVNNPAKNKNLDQKAHNVIEYNKNENNKSPPEILDLLKQKLKVTAHRLRNHRESYQRRTDNKNFNTNQRVFYRELMNNQRNAPNIDENQYPNQTDIKNFWSKIWEKPVTHKKTATWIKSEKQRTSRVKQMPPETITSEDLKKVLNGAPNWRAPGPDKLQNFWYKKFSSTHEKLAELFTIVVNNPELAPYFLTKGITYLLPKTNPSIPEASKYRPITCLPTMYKFLTGIIARKIYQHLENNALLTEEQKGCRKEARGCKEQLIIDTIITREAIKKKKELHVAYIDYQKAFDSIPHSYLIECLSIYKVCPLIIYFLKETMGKWETSLVINKRDEQTEPIKMKILRGIFQGDALSALWFCLALNPLTNTLNKLGSGYTVTNTENEYEVSHLMYMDDIKIYSSNANGLKKLIRVTEEFSNDINMNFGLDKCKTNAIKHGKWQKSEEYKMLRRTGGQIISSMEKGECYKYLGYAQSTSIDDSEVKQQLRQEMESRLKSVIKTKLSAINMAKAVNTYVAPVITSSFGVIKWSATDLEEINRTIRVTFTKHRLHHPRASKERFHLPRKMGGRGIIDTREAQQQQIQNLRKYFYEKAKSTPLHAGIIKADTNLTPLRLANEQTPQRDEYSKEARLRDWSSKELHGRYPNNIGQTNINKQASLGWLMKGNLFPETEGFLCAIQDQVIATKSYKKHILKDNTIANTNCRMCGNQQETIEHIINGCTTLAPRDYTNRHNNVAKIVHREICLQYGLINTSEAYYKYSPETIQENERCMVYWDREIITHRNVQHNRPDIFVHNKEDNNIILIDIAIPSPVNIPRKTTEKREKYAALAEDLKQVWRVPNVRIVPIIIGSTGEIPVQLITNLENLNIKKNAYLEMQKAAILGTCNIVRKVMNIN